MAITPEQEAQARALLAKGDKLGQQASAQTGVAYNPQYTSYTPAPSINSSNTQSSPAPSLPAYTPPPPPDPNAGAQSIQSILDQYNQQSAEESAALGEQGSITNEIKSILDKQGSMGARQGELEQQAGLPGLQKNLNDINAQIQAINASAFKETNRAENRQAPTFAIYGEQAKIEREKSVQTYGLAAAASAIQGNIALANDNVKRALDAEFGGLQYQLQYQQLLLDLNKDKLSAAQQKKAQAMQIQLQKRQEQLDQQRQERESVYSIMNNAAQNGANSQILNEIMKATSREQAIQIAAKYGVVASPDTQVVKLDNGNTVVIDQRTGKIINTIGGAGVQGGGTSASGPGAESVQYYANLLATGKIGLQNVPQSIRNAVVVASQGNVNSKLPEAAITNINQTQSALSNLSVLKQTIQDNLQYVGPISGLAALNPYSKARQVQAQVDRVRQVVGKALEGGVLRKEDEEKYKKILATITDTPETALYKIDALIASITRDIENYKTLQSQSGYYVPGKGSYQPEDLRSKYGY